MTAKLIAGADRIPVVLGGALLGIAVAGLAAGLLDFTFSLPMETGAALFGMIVAKLIS